jgi:hypothetical protein
VKSSYFEYFESSFHQTPDGKLRLATVLLNPGYDEFVAATFAAYFRTSNFDASIHQLFAYSSRTEPEPKCGATGNVQHLGDMDGRRKAGFHRRNVLTSAQAERSTGP